MKILITGGAGFIGTNFTHYYFDKHQDHEIVVLDKLTYAGTRENLAQLEGSNRFKFAQIDLVDKDAVTSLFTEEKFDSVVNFAAESHVDRSIHDPSVFVMTNVVGTHNLLDASLEHGVSRYHQVSTDEVYGDLGDGSTDLFTEKTLLAPSSPYSSSKAAADLICLAYHRTYGLPVTISRCSNNYGPYQYPEKLIPYFYFLASQDKKVPVYGDGMQIRDWIYVTDHCEAVDLVLQKGKTGEIYNMGGNCEKSNLEITREILDFLGKSNDLIEYVEDRKGHDRRYAIDNSKMEVDLSWKPKVSFEEGLTKTFDWYKENTEWLAKKS
ncbi:MAG: dTDP-glucose 4,6-dehydratase [Patescibacteria group bacterium]|nr:dTDP-glucose 4,6-dehydratase [Patescibacteria group bacterium]